MKTAEELLRPRYKLIGEYPNQAKSLGYIYEGLEIEPETLITLSRYPKLFKRLNWWEEREIDDMPMYVKWVKKFESLNTRECGDIMMVDEWFELTHFISEGEGWKVTGGYFEPATEQEYNDYIKSKPTQP